MLPLDDIISLSNNTTFALRRTKPILSLLLLDLLNDSSEEDFPAIFPFGE